MEAEMIFGGITCRSQLEVPLPPIVGNGMEVGFKPKIIVADSPTARRHCKGYRLWVIGYRMGLFGAMVGNGAAAAPERPNNKNEDAQVLHE
jgi:hypothetical protein